MQETNIINTCTTKSRWYRIVKVTGPVCTTQSRYVAMWAAYLEHLYIDYQLVNILSIGTGMVKGPDASSFFKQDLE